MTTNKIDIKTITAVARKALMHAEPLYFSWSAEQQENFRATMSKEARLKVSVVLLKELKNIDCTRDTAEEIWQDLPLAELNDLNWAHLLTKGIGEDWVFLNTFLKDGVSLLDFPTLYDYDFDDHLFQEKARAKDDDNYQLRDYYALRFNLWVRLILNSKLYYANFFSLADYIKWQLEEMGSNEIEKLIPHEYVSGKDDGKEDSDGNFLLDLRVEANGLERQLEELKKRWWKYLFSQEERLSKQQVNKPAAVYFRDTSKPYENSCDFIFNNASALRQVSWRSLLADCKVFEADFKEVDKLLAEEYKHAKSWLNETYQDIMRNFDPKIIPFKRKRKILLAPSALDSLAKLQDEDDL